MDFTLLYRNSNDKQCVHVEQCEILYDSDHDVRNDFVET